MIAPSRTRMATTSARLGRETKMRRPSRDVNASSTNWSCPSPTSWRIALKYARRSGLDWISAIRAWMSGMMLIRLRRLKRFGSTMSAVPAQLLPTVSTGRNFLLAAGAVAGRAASTAAASARAQNRRIGRNTTESVSVRSRLVR
jgi:hypothetical protein